MQGHILEYGYDAMGMKRTERSFTAVPGVIIPMGAFAQVSLSYPLPSQLDYCGNVVYNGNGSYFNASRVYTPEGYIKREYTMSGNWEYYYTLKDHLGSARSEFKVNGTTVTNVGYTHYYPSGIEITDPGWSQTLQSRERFNNKELLTAHGWNALDMGNRQADLSRLQFPTPDRFAGKFPWQSPYCVAANNPVRYIDINGDSIWIEQGKGFLGLGGKETLRYENGKLYNKDGSDYTGKVKGFLSKTITALNKVGTFDSGKGMLNELQNSTDNFTIVKSFDGNSYNTGSNTIKFNPSSTEGGLNTRGVTDRPTFIGLTHEMAHALDDSRGTINLNTVSGQTFTYAEQFSTHLENQIRAEHFLPLRTHYGIDVTGGVYPLVNSGNSIHYPGYNYYNALKIKSTIPFLNVKR